ncbi:MFS transporter [Cyanobium sp. FACHB-13342]|uniref:MFS transporter n=1 Tax=Cyanobium sp. FACHB-13342 TaxID=2692793 RepID=UPI001680DED5|nr:MFS transporter [Cyanobium sp. FACHB-13342]MBD2421913.1 MFS transporter [Cyanobium sp. FACHB-13342]
MSPHPTRALAVPFLGILASLQLIDPSVANNALVKAGQSLAMQGPTLALAASISTLAQAATVLLMGFLGDRLERRQVLMGALLLAIAGDGIALAAPHAGLFLLGRALAGIAVGGVLVLSFAAVGAVSRADQLGKALGVWHLWTIAGFIAGSLLGGLLANSSWRLGLGLVPLLALLCLALLPLLVPPMPADTKLRPDWPGLISIAAAMVLFLSGVCHAIQGLSSPQFLVPSLSGVVLFGVHLLIERHRQEPIFPVALYRRGCFAAAIVSGIAGNVAWAVVQLQTSNFWQLVQHFSTAQVAMAQLPLLVSSAVAAVPAGWLMRPGRRTTQLMAGGILVLVLGLLWFAAIRADSAYSALVMPMVLVGSGLAFMIVPQATLFVQEAPPGSLGPVTAFRTTTGQFGFALGFAASAAMVNGFGAANLHQQVLKLGGTTVWSSELEAKVRAALGSGRLSHATGLPAQAIQLMSDTYASGLAGTMLVAALLVGLLGAISLLLLVIGHRQEGVEQGTRA